MDGRLTTKNKTRGAEVRCNSDAKKVGHFGFPTNQIYQWSGGARSRGGGDLGVEGIKEKIVSSKEMQKATKKKRFIP